MRMIGTEWDTGMGSSAYLVLQTFHFPSFRARARARASFSLPLSLVVPHNYIPFQRIPQCTDSLWVTKSISLHFIHF